MDCLPTELLVMIFELLSYEDLQLSLLPTCKMFYCILNRISTSGSSPLETILFRESLLPWIDKNHNLNHHDFKIHPLFEKLYLYNQSKQPHYFLSNGKAIDTNASVMMQNATSPPVGYIMLAVTLITSQKTRYRSFDVMFHCCGHGVTVGNILNSIKKLFLGHYWIYRTMKGRRLRGVSAPTAVSKSGEAILLNFKPCEPTGGRKVDDWLDIHAEFLVETLPGTYREKVPGIKVFQ